MAITINGDGTITGLSAGGLPNDSVQLADMAHGTDGQIITYDASGAPTAVGPGNDGEVLTSTGAGSPPAFEAIATAAQYISADTGWLTLGTGTNLTITGIEAGADQLTLLINTLVFSGTDYPRLELGDSGGIETSGYVGIGIYIGTGTGQAASVTAGWQPYGPSYSSGGGNIGAMRMDMWRADSSTHRWQMDGHAAYANGTHQYMFPFRGTKELSGELTQIRFGPAGSDTMVSGCEYRLLTWK